QNAINNPDYPWLMQMFGEKSAGGLSAGDLMTRAMSYVSNMAGSLWSKGQAAISLFSLLIVTPVVAFYLACDWDRMMSSIDQLVPVKQRKTVRRIAHDINASISAYVH